MQKHYDKVPTQGSTNPVKSDGLHQQLATIGLKIDELNGTSISVTRGESGWTWGKYCKLDGTLADSDNWGRKSFHLLAGQTMKVTTYGSGSGVITQTSDDVNFTILAFAPADTTGYNAYTYTATEECDVTAFLRAIPTEAIPTLEMNGKVGIAGTAKGTSYENTESGLTSTDVQDALDEVSEEIGNYSEERQLTLTAAAFTNKSLGDNYIPKGSTITDFGTYEGSLQLCPLSTFNISNVEKRLYKNQLPYIVQNDIRSVRPDVAVTNGVFSYYTKESGIKGRLKDIERHFPIISDDIQDGSVTKEKLSSDVELFRTVEVTDLSEETVVDAIARSNLYNVEASIKGKYINTTTGLPTGSNNTYETSDYIEVEDGEPYCLKQMGASGESTIERIARFVSCFDSSKALVGNVLQYVTITGYIFPTGTKYVMLTVNNTAKESGTVKRIFFYKGTEDKPYEDYGKDYFIKPRLIEEGSIDESRLTDELRQEIKGNVAPHPNGMTISGDMSSGSTLELPRNSVKNNKAIAFSARIGSWGSTSKLSVGQGSSAYLASWVEVDSTNIYVYRYTTSAALTATLVHGLEIENNIQIEISKANSPSGVSITLCSNGHSYTGQASYDGDNGKVWAKVENGSLSGCSLGWFSQGLMYDNWLFGDSYFSLNSGDRWTRYLITNNHTKNLLNGYSGENSTVALADLGNLLAIATPKRIVWCLGMNDKDTDTEVSQRWKSGYDEVVSLCSEKGIELVLATIPNVIGGITDDDVSGNNNQFRNHQFKNAIVKASGYRYIDFESAVSSDSSKGLWFGTTEEDITGRTGNGMLSSDGVHPTTLGAKALYHQAVADCPEIMTY
jgi:hypothetical protein